MTSKLSTTTRPEGLASLSTINGAITPWRDAFAEQTSVPLLISRGGDTAPRGRFTRVGSAGDGNLVWHCQGRADASVSPERLAQNQKSQYSSQANFVASPWPHSRSFDRRPKLQGVGCG
jgi:hypothetical protein